MNFYDFSKAFDQIKRPDRKAEKRRKVIEEKNLIPTSKVSYIELPDEGDVLVHYENGLFPRRGIVMGIAGNAVMRMVKAYLLSGAFLYQRKTFSRVCWTVLKPYYLVENRWCRSVQEFRRLSPFSDKITDVISVILQYDDAYRYRFQYMFHFVDKKYSTLSCMRRAVRALIEGEKSNRVKKRLRILYHIIPILWIFYWRTLGKMKKESDLSLLRMDTYDKHHASFKRNFDFSKVCSFKYKNINHGRT